MEPFIATELQSAALVDYCFQMCRYLGFERLIEPLIRNGSILERLCPGAAVLNDPDPDTINVLQVIKHNPSMLWTQLCLLNGCNEVNHAGHHFIDPVRRAASYLHRRHINTFGTFIELEQGLKYKLFDLAVLLNGQEIVIAKELLMDTLREARKKDLIHIVSNEYNPVLIDIIKATKSYLMWVTNIDFVPEGFHGHLIEHPDYTQIITNF